MPTGLSIGEAVFDDDPDGKFDDCVGVMGTGSGKLSRMTPGSTSMTPCR
jgi:hypothetical protein